MRVCVLFFLVYWCVLAFEAHVCVYVYPCASINGIDFFPKNNSATLISLLRFVFVTRLFCAPFHVEI